MRNLQEDWLKRLSAAPFGIDVLKVELKDFADPIQKVHELVAKGVFVRLKRGLFCVAPEYGAVADRRKMANAIFGPSYVSFETALAEYGLIPELAQETISAVIGRGRRFTNRFGRFSYRAVPKGTFAIGVKSVDGALVASPEKALCDFLDSRPSLRLSSPNSLREYLEVDVRFDFDAFGSPDISIITAFAASGRKKPLYAALERMFK